MVILEQIRNNLQAAIRNSGLTQTELAKRLGIGQQTISEYMHGRSMPALDTFANLCAVLDLDANDILCLNSQPPTVSTDNRHHNIYNVTGNNNRIR